MPALTPRRRKALYWIAGLFLAYVLIGFLIVPPIVRAVAVKQASKILKREVSIESVRFNPLTLSAAIRGLAIKEKDGQPFVSWDEVYVNFQLSSFFGRPWVFKEISTTRPALSVRMNGDGTFNFSDLLPPADTNAAPSEPAKPLAVRIDRLRVDGAVLSLNRQPQDASAAPVEPPPPPVTDTNSPGGILLLLQSITNAVALLADSTNAISATLRDITITNCALNLEDLANARPARLRLDEINLLAKNVSNVPRTNLTAGLSLRWNTNGMIRTDVDASLAPPSVDVHLKLDNLELRPLDPYLDAKLNVFIIGSKLGLDSRIQLRTAPGALPKVSFAGDAWLNDFNTIDGVLTEGLLNWSAVRLSGIDANLNPAIVHIREIAVHDAYARLVIETNRTINLLAALRLANTNAPADTNPPPPAPEVAPTLAAATNAPARPPLPIERLTISQIVISNAHADFTDRSLTPNVSITLEEVNGKIAGLSSDELQRAQLDLAARVDKVGPVAITGTINPFRENETNEVKIAVNDVDLTAASPYAGKFAGYKIAKGKLNLALAYHIHGRNVRSENLITLDQFTFGEKVDSPEATKLPVRLAIAVLKDREGKIVLDVPIEGSLDDPQFRLHKVIWRTIGNIFMKVVTSPFAVLGSVFGGMGEEIRYQDFASGGTELPEASRAKLDALIKALYERPGLQVEIAGSIDPVGDRDALRALALDKQLRSQKWLSLRKTDRADVTPEQVVVTPEERPALVKRLFAEAQSKGLLVQSTDTNGVAAPLPVLYRPSSTDRGATDLLRKETAVPQSAAKTPGTVAADPFEQALLNSMPVTDAEFQALAAERAKVVREYILQSGKVEVERLFLTEGSAVKTEGSRAYLQLR